MKQSEVDALCAWLENNSIPDTQRDGTNTYPMIRASAMIRYLYRSNVALNSYLDFYLSKQKNELPKQKAP